MMIDRDKSGLLLIDMQEKLVPLVMDHRECIGHCEWMLGVANVLQIPAITTQQYPKGLGATIQSLQTLIDTQRVINKITFSAMRDEDGEAQIRASHKTHWVLTGIETHVCVMQTALDLKEAGFKVFVVDEATSARSAHDKKLAISRMRAAGIHIVTREMVVFEWLKTSGAAEFKQISQGFIK
ncbi:MAG: isochorismatase family protein [Gammaproteobacteria bacterium]